MRSSKTTLRSIRWWGLASLLVLALSGSAMAQGSIFGTVSNSDLSTPANGEISFVGYLDNTDEEIRIESADGAGYDAGNWFDDFQNYLTEAPGNPYDYHFYNIANGQGFQLSGAIPNNSFQQENITLAAIAWPVPPSGLTGVTASGSTVILNWTGVGGLTYHVYRRMASSNGSFFRIDDPTGALTNPGVSTNYYVDATVDGVSDYQYVIVAQGPTGNLSPHSTIITVGAAAADAPILVSINPTTGTALGGTVVTVNGSGFDPAGAQVFFGATPAAATVLSPFQMTAITPAGAIGAAVDVYVTNTASALSSNILTGGFVYAANTDPILATIGGQTVVEGVRLQFATSAADPDGNTPVMTSSTLPGTATYIDNGNGTGSFDWTPGFTEAGIYSVTFYATDAIVPSSADSEVVTITVTEAGNQTPVLVPIADTVIDENQTLAFQVTATDADLDVIGLAVTDAPLNSTFTDNGDGTADFSFTPDFTQAGIYNITFTATDTDLNSATIVVEITVNNINQLPVLAAIGPQATDETVELIFLVNASDTDGDVPVLTTSVLPGTAVFVDSLNGVGSFTWTPGFAEAGSYEVTFYATDGAFATEIDSELVTITVNDAGNQAPVLATIDPQTVFEGTNLNFVVTATDADGTIPVLTAEGLPVNATFLDNTDGTGTFDFNPDYVQAGLYTVSFIAGDGSLADTALVDITVTESGNVPPEIDSVGNFAVNEGDQLIVTINANDPDGGGIFPALSISTTLLHYTFVDNGDGTGTLTYNPDFYDAGPDTINFLAIDFGTPRLTTTEVSVITTADINQAPEIDSIGPFAVAVGDSLGFVVTASDDTDPNTAHRVILSTVGLPANATFTDNGNSTGMFTFRPDASQAGPQTVTFLGVDQGSPQLSTTFEVGISVVTENARPVLDPIGPQVVTEGELLTINLSASDPDGAIPSFLMADEPEGSNLVDNGDGTGVFTFTPGFFGTTRLASVTFKATDGIAIAKEVVLIQIYDGGNQAPIFDSIPAPVMTEGDTLVQGITASDPDGNPLTMWIDESTVSMPANSSFLYLGLGAAAITFEPDFSQAGLYDFYVVAADGPDGEPETLADTIVVTFQVDEFGNHAPVLADIPAASLTVVEGSSRSFTVTASDIDADSLIHTSSALPANATYVDNYNGTAQFTFNPDFSQDGTHPIEFYVSDGTESDTLMVDFVVLDNNRLPFVFAPGYSYSMYEIDTLTLLVTGFDADGTIPILSAHMSGLETLAPNMTFTDNLDGTGALVFIPDYTQGASASNPQDYFIVFRATDAAYTDVYQEDATVTVGVIDRNQPPVISFPTGAGPHTIFEGEPLSFFVSVSDNDPILSSPTIVAQNVPVNASFSISAGASSGEFRFTPDFLQAGIYTVRFIGIDDRAAADTAEVLITVLDAGNQAPTFGPTAYETDTLLIPTGHGYEIVLAPYDPESDSMTVEAYPMIPGATWGQNADGTWSYYFSPDSSQVGSIFEVTFVATDYPGLASATLTVHPRVVAFLRGDLDSDNVYTVNDLSYFIDYLFREGPAPLVVDAADTDANGAITINDLSLLIYYMFRNGPQPAP